MVYFKYMTQKKLHCITKKKKVLFSENTYIEVFIPGENSNFQVSELAAGCQIPSTP